MNKLVDQSAFRRILFRNLLLPLMTGFLSSAVFVALIVYLGQSNGWVEHTVKVIGQVHKLEKLIVDAETGMRGFVISGRPSFLMPYDNAMADLPDQIINLENLVTDNPVQTARLKSAQVVFADWTQFSQSTVDAAKKSPAQAAKMVSEGRGKELTDKLREILDRFSAEEQMLLNSRSETAKRLSGIVLSVVVSLSLLFGVLIAWMGRAQLFSLSQSYERSIKLQREQNERLERQQWIDSGVAELSQKVIGAKSVEALLEQILNYLGQYLNVRVGVAYVTKDQSQFEYAAGYALVENFKPVIPRFRRGEGQLGLAVINDRPVELKGVGNEYLKVASALGNNPVRDIVIVPMSSEGEVSAVLELGFGEEITENMLAFLNEASKGISSSVKSAQYRERLERLLSEVQNQAEELQTQQEELRVNNEELEEQTKLLKEAQTRLEAQHAELEQTNSQLEEQTQALEHQKDALSHRNDELNTTRNELERKADELQRASKYKSEFLANMSHELRTPLNSSLILAKLLSENKDNNLTKKQVEFAEQIMNSGNDLLNLINDILDLSKVEAGKLDISPENIAVEGLVRSLERVFNPIAKQKNLEFAVDVEAGIPSQMFSDRTRVEQILKNLLSNAFKFTETGAVTLKISKSSEAQYANMLKFSVSDTGIGIPLNQQDVIFEAFRQADGTTNRRFGGTGLGLSISQDLAHLLGGFIRVKSEPGKGSCFSLALPVEYKPVTEEALQKKSMMPMAAAPVMPTSAKTEPKPEVKPLIHDDRKLLTKGAPGERLILAVEDDPQFAQILLDLAHEQNFKAIIAGTAEEALDIAKNYPLSAVILDMNLPDHSGLFVLDNLKQHSSTRHIPVHVVSAHDFTQKAMEMGAIGYLLKPVKRDQLSDAFTRLEEKMNQNIKRVLVVEDDQVQRNAIRSLIEDTQIEVTTVETGTAALKYLQEQTFDCLIMDISLPDMNGFELLDKIAAQEENSHPPVIVYTGRDLSREEEEKLRRHSQSVIIKGAKSPDRLLNEVTLFLHRVESQLGSERQMMLEHLRNREKVFESKSILLVDDDIRNVFALTAALEQKGARVIIARDGQEALRKLESEKDINLVLMDIMMPVMNGYEAMREIRSQRKYLKLPIIALTAKAMKDDRELCLQAGANDYLAKPIDMDKLLSLMRIWISYGDGRG